MPSMSWLAQDVRYGIRGLRKDRGFALLAIFALALGIGATTVIFSVIDGILLDPFPYRNSDRLTQFFVHDSTRSDRFGRGGFTMPEYLAIKEQNHVFEDIIGTANLDILYTNGDGTKLFRGGKITTNAFPFLGIKPLLGRTIVADDGRPGAVPVVLLGYQIWHDEFHSDPGILGTTIKLNGEQRTVIGVMPQRFRFGALDLWMPNDFSNNDVNLLHSMWLLARRKPGVSLKTTSDDLGIITHRLAAIYPKNYPARFDITTMTLADSVVGQFRVMLFALMAAVVMLLLIACSNVANLLLARATAREKEIAIRASLGAGRARIVRQLLVESFLLATAGCLLGCLFAYGGVKGVVAAVPEGIIPAEAHVSLNFIVLLFAIGIMFSATLLCGLAPSLHSSRGDLHNLLKDSNRGTSSGLRHGRIRSALVIGQVALSIVLLVGAGLMMRSLFALQHVELGLNPVNILVARTPLPKGRYDTAEQKRIFFSQVLEKIKALPGVVTATETSTLPPYGGIGSEVTVPGKTHAQTWLSLFQLCSDGYFPTLELRLLRGRLLSPNDIDSARRVAVINQTLAHNFFGKDDPLGQSIKFNFLDTIADAPHDAYFEIIGIVADAKNRGLQDAPMPEAFLPYTITGSFERGILVRTAVAPLSLLTSVRHEIWSVDSGVALTLTGTLEDYLSRFSYSQPRFGLILFGVFAALGLMLVAIGVFSVMAYTVSLQRHEIGIRMALGAQRENVLRIVLRRGLLLIAMGIAVGELASFGLTRLVASQIWGVSPRDPLTFGAVLALLVIVGLCACLLPARRATRVDPLIALRYE
ncbi:MAG TPA: ABC transporter permease [Terriglobales bacterium]|nr:ABC transporter permease [Terriglobales bacterium]